MSKINESAVRRLAERQGYYLRRVRGGYNLISDRKVVIMEGVSLDELHRLLSA
jgi:hypothetical protein